MRSYRLSYLKTIVLAFLCAVAAGSALTLWGIGGEIVLPGLFAVRSSWFYWIIVFTLATVGVLATLVAYGGFLCLRRDCVMRGLSRKSSGLMKL